jgi:hypothetical protein
MYDVFIPVIASGAIAIALTLIAVVVGIRIGEQVKGDK